MPKKEIKKDVPKIPEAKEGEDDYANEDFVDET